MEKKCNQCGETKPVSEFQKSKKCKYGVRGTCKICMAARMKKWYETEKGQRAILRERIRKFSLTLDQYDKMVERQSNLCAICKQPETTRGRLTVDHDHRCCDGNFSCGKCVRGLLCDRCNTGVARFRDDPDILLAAHAYIVGK